MKLRYIYIYMQSDEVSSFVKYIDFSKIDYCYTIFDKKENWTRSWDDEVKETKFFLVNSLHRKISWLGSCISTPLIKKPWKLVKQAKQSACCKNYLHVKCVKHVGPTTVVSCPFVQVQQSTSYSFDQSYCIYITKYICCRTAKVFYLSLFFFPPSWVLIVQSPQIAEPHSIGLREITFL